MSRLTTRLNAPPTAADAGCDTLGAMGSEKKPADDVRAIVERYYATVSNLAAPVAELEKLLAKKVSITEHPNLISPTGAVRGRAETLAGFESGKDLLSEQAFDVHEIVVTKDRAAVRATWRGTIGVDAGPLKAGTQLLAHVASFLTVRDGAVVEQETFDCYEQFQ